MTSKKCPYCDSEIDCVAEESKAYARGYAAGRKRQQVDIDREAMQRRQNENWNRAFLVAFQAAIEKEFGIQGYDSKNYPQIMDVRARVAAYAADAAVHRMRSNVP